MFMHVISICDKKMLPVTQFHDLKITHKQQTLESFSFVRING